jgi:hypothetical protein
MWWEPEEGKTAQGVNKNNDLILEYNLPLEYERPKHMWAKTNLTTPAKLAI